MIAPLGWLGPCSHECDGRCKQDPCAYGSAWDLDCRMAGEGIVGALVQATNRSAVVSLAVDFKKGAGEKVRRRFFNRKANGVSSARESPVSKRSVVVFAIARREQFCRNAVIEFDHDRGLKSSFGLTG